MLAGVAGLRRDPLAFARRVIAEYGDIVRLQLGPIRAFLLNDPDAVHAVLVEKSKDYLKGRSARAVGRILGQGLITSEGELWRKQRRLIQPAFHREYLGGLVATMVDAVDSMLADWSMNKQQNVFDVHSEMMRLTLRIIGPALFSVNIDDRTSEVATAFAAANAHADYYAKALFLLPTWVPTPRGLAVRRTMRTLGSLVRRIIEEHRTKERSDLVSMLMASRDEESGERMSDRQLHDEVLTMVAAGHETTATALSWCFYLLSNHPAAERLLHAEVNAVLGDRSPALADLPKLIYTSWIVQETMRLYPPVWIIERETSVDDELRGYRIPAGSSVSVFIYGLQRHERYWDSPGDFKPERFSPDRCEGRPRSIYLPFGEGPRMCVGGNFAMMEAQIILAMIAQRYRLAVVPNHAVEMEPLITLRPKYGLQVRAEALGPVAGMQPQSAVRL